MSLFGDSLLVDNASFIGHADIIDHLSLAFDRGNIPHAILLSGVKGVGKHKLSLYIAHYLLHGGDSFKDFCTQTFLDDHSLDNTADFVSVSPEKNTISADQIRLINNFCSLTPVEADKKVVIIDDCDTMNKNASNAFLKTLEEAPGHAFFILIAQRYHTLDDTIRSRCIHLHLPLLLDQDIRSYLERENDRYKEISSDFQDVIIQFSGGSIGKALTFLEHCDEGFFKSFFCGVDFLLSQSEQTYDKKKEFQTFLLKESEEKYELIASIFPLIFILIAKKIARPEIELPAMLMPMIEKYQKTYGEYVSLLLKRCFFLYERISLLLKYNVPPYHMRKEDIIEQILSIKF